MSRSIVVSCILLDERSCAPPFLDKVSEHHATRLLV